VYVLITVPYIIRQRTPPATVALTLVKHVSHSGPEVFFKTCIAMKFVDDDDDDDVFDLVICKMPDAPEHCSPFCKVKW